jgi:hypothetical protein
VAAVTDLVKLRAGWALWGKQPGARQDYSVLGCSPGPFSPAEFEAIITRFAVGSPDVTVTGAAALPWVTVSWVGVDEDPHLGISVTDNTGQVDGFGRPTTQKAYFCVPYAQLARTPAGYCDLYDAVAAQVPALRAGDGPMIELTIPALSSDRLADAVRRAGEQTVMSTAALMLSGPVSVVQAEGTSLRDRLEFIDAVTSLLPYGYRVRFAGATWSDSRTKHRARLAFAARPPEGAAVVAWRRVVPIPAASRLPLAYRDRLRQLSQDPALSPGAPGLSAVIAQLAADVAPRTFDQPQGAFDSLNRGDQPGLTRWLAARGELDADARRYWAGQLASLRAHTPQTQAWLDTALLMVGGPPTALPPAQEPAAAAYAQALADVWTELSGAYPTFSGESCARGLARYLGGLQWTATPQQALAVTEVARRLGAFDPRFVLLTTVASALAAAPAARQWDFAQEWLAWAAANEPEAIRERLAAAGPGASPESLVGLCVQACRAGIDPDTALRALAKSGALSDASQAYQVLTGLQELAAAGAGEDLVNSWQFRFSELLAAGEFGPELGRQLRVLASERTRRDLWLELRFLEIFAAAGRDGECEWTADEREELTAIAGEIESMLKKSWKLQLPKLRLPIGRGTPAADHPGLVAPGDGAAAEDEVRRATSQEGGGTVGELVTIPGEGARRLHAVRVLLDAPRR